MILKEITPIQDSDLPVQKFASHLQLGTGFAEDDVQNEVLASFLRATLAAIEARTGKIILARDFEWDLTCWRQPNAQGLPVTPIQTLKSVSIVTRLDEKQDFPLEFFRLEKDVHSVSLRTTNGVLPQIPNDGTAVVTFEAGFGAWDDVPADLRQAIFMLAAHYYEYRDNTGLGQGCMPFGVTSLIERFRTLRLGRTK